MAIQGKLVPQGPNDEPASVLLEKIHTEKQKLIKEGKIKKDKYDSVIFKGDDNRYYEKIGNSEPVCIEAELPFDIPDNWCWTRLGNYALTVFSGKSPKYSKEPTKHKVIGQQANQWNGVNLHYVKYCIDSFVEEMPISYYLQDGDVLLNTLGNGTLGRSGYFDKSICDDPLLTDGHLFVFRNYSKSLSRFLHIFLQVKYDEIVKSANGSTNQTFLNLSKTMQWLMPVPPFNEVERIINKINEFNYLIIDYDKLEQEKSKLDGEIYDKLKKSILQYAIQGKLVPQDANDEPASELLKRIRTEKKAQLGKKYVDSYIYKGDDNCYYEHIDGKPKDLAIEVPFDLPVNWEWCRLGILALYKKGPFGSSLTKEMFVPKSNNSVKVYEQKNAIYKDFSLGNYYINKQKYNTMKTFEVFPNDIIVSCAGTIGETYVLPQDCPQGIINQALMKISLFEQEIVDFYLIYFDYILKIQAQKNSKGSAIKNIPPFEILKNMLIPIPPLAEQKRMVNKINEIFSKL